MSHDIFVYCLSNQSCFLPVQFISGAKDCHSVAAASDSPLGVLILFMIYLRRIEHGELIVVSESNVILPGLTGHRIVEWGQLTNVIKRDDLLTLDFKNNKLMQVQIINSNDVAENEFNQFCRQQLQEK